MQNHKSYTVLAPILQKYPRAAGSLFQTYNDIVYAQQWSDVDLVQLDSISRAAISGKRPNTDATVYVVPCSLAETLSFDWLQQAFAQLQDPQEIFLAITSDDASLVYYKLSRGMVKPQL
uniref:tRNA-splicing endonuclease subunit Sen15 domain-containing protein n=1 Tax=Mycena chlorophos TaxID=658473 RepID=A0ABQ0LI41_MYCCL|nr:predicted protein [Mycena chlorophos]